jgi:predicted DNA-binding transcriptional regulator AlpA
VDVNDLVTKADIAGMLGVSRERVAQLAAEQENFPASVGMVGKSLVWHRADVERWQKTWARRPGRPPKEGGDDAKR